MSGSSVVHDVDEPVALARDRARLLEHGDAARGRDDGLARAIEDADAEELLELVDLHAERRLRDVALLGGGAERALAIDGHEVPRLASVTAERSIPVTMAAAREAA
jgi:hypothetical protein